MRSHSEDLDLSPFCTDGETETQVAIKHSRKSKAGAQTLAVPLSGCVTLNQSFLFPVPASLFSSRKLENFSFVVRIKHD